MVDWKNNLSLQQLFDLHRALGHTPVLGRILALVEAAGCRTIGIEENPAEKEYAAEYKLLYSRVFEMEGKNSPKRLHFFQGNIAAPDEVTDGDGRYLGYCDIRPTRERSISEALIDRKVFVPEGSPYLFLICQREFSIPFGPKTLTVRAFPYVQQDGVVIRCAQAALASAARFFNVEKTGPDFTEIAAAIPTGAGGRQLPSNGLTAQQMGLCISKLGREPVIYDYRFSDPTGDAPHPEQIIYRYLESGIPVLIGINAGQEMHALIVVGHSFSPDSWLAQTSTMYYQQPKTGGFHHCSTNWVERFIVQDDNLGPYTLAPSAFLQAKGVCPLVMVPLADSVHLMAEDAEAFVGDFLSPHVSDFGHILDSIIAGHLESKLPWPAENAFWYQEFRQHSKRGDLILRTSLRDTVVWKESMKQASCYQDIAPILASLPMPGKVWVVELSWDHIFLHKRRMCGEVVLDPTATLSKGSTTIGQAWLWLHVPGLVVYRNAKTDDIKTSVLQRIDEIRPHHFTTP